MRHAAGIVLLGFSVLSAGGCMPSEKAHFERHLGTILEPLEDSVALGVRGEMTATAEEVSAAAPLLPEG